MAGADTLFAELAKRTERAFADRRNSTEQPIGAPMPGRSRTARHVDPETAETASGEAFQRAWEGMTAALAEASIDLDAMRDDHKAYRTLFDRNERSIESAMEKNWVAIQDLVNGR